MAEDRSQQFQIPNEMRAMAEQSMAQARKVFGEFIETARKAAENLQGQVEATQSGAREISRKAMTFAEENVSSSFEFAQKLMSAKDANDVMRLQKDYLNRQMRVLTEQAQELGQSAAAIARSSTKSSS